MEFKTTSLADCVVVIPNKIGDQRGYFARSWCQQELEDAGLKGRICQSNMAHSPLKGTLRGLHLQLAPHEEAKFVRCVRGSIFDVVVDLRPSSPTFMSWHGVELNSHDACALYVPEGCATGYLTLEDDVEIYYHTSAKYSPDVATGVRYNDPAFDIKWPAEPKVLSEQDAGWPSFDR